MKEIQTQQNCDYKNKSKNSNKANKKTLAMFMKITQQHCNKRMIIILYTGSLCDKKICISGNQKN